MFGAGESHRHFNITQMHDLTVTPGKISAKEASKMAGIKPGDVDVFQPYDAFTIAVLLQLEISASANGEKAGAFVAAGNLAPGGSLPAMTSGGGLSYCHPARSVFC